LFDAAAIMRLSTTRSAPKQDAARASCSKTGRDVATVAVFQLVLHVKLPKRLDLDRDAERADDSRIGLMPANWV